MGIAIREATIDDAEALLGYAERLFSEQLPGLYRRATPTIEEERAFVSGYADSPNSALLMAVDDGDVVGLLGLAGRALPQEVHVGSVAISVAKDRRGEGIGTRLFDALFEWAAQRDVTRLEIEAFANNPAAVRLYESVGFELEGVRRGAVIVDDELVDVVCLARVDSAANETLRLCSIPGMRESILEGLATPCSELEEGLDW